LIQTCFSAGDRTSSVSLPQSLYSSISLSTPYPFTTSAPEPMSCFIRRDALEIATSCINGSQTSTTSTINRMVSSILSSMTAASSSTTPFSKNSSGMKEETKGIRKRHFLVMVPLQASIQSARRSTSVPTPLENCPS
jgi:hypothetical protein